MNLTQRQYEILKYLVTNNDDYITSSDLASLFQVSSRTIKNEIPILKEYISGIDSFYLEVLPGKGIKVNIINKQDFINELLEFSKNDITISDSYDSQRDISILRFIINTRRSISKEGIMDHFFISESTFYKSYNNIKDLIAPFNLSIQHSKAKGYNIIGNEKDIRSLIARYELIGNHRNNLSSLESISTIYNYVADLFINYQYKVTEQILQNISSHVLLMQHRVKHGNRIEKINGSDLSDHIEYRIAEAICEKYLITYGLPSEQFRNEVLLLTQTILGKVNYYHDENIQFEINEFISFSFKNIHQKFGINFEPVEKLRLFLVLHMVPLIYRIKSGTQLRNLMGNEVNYQFPHANDISLYFSLLFFEKFGLSISPDELSYIALYFNFGIEELNLAKSSKRVLIITDLRPSETVLLRHRLLSWFANQIIDISFVSPHDNIENFDDYDAIFATDLYSPSYKNAVTLIDIFPKDDDYKKINLALNGFTNVEDIIEKFSYECFFYGKAENKEDALKIVCENASHKYDLPNDFYEAISSRESIASTYFGEGVAIPHPLAPISEETFVSIAILEEPILWNKDQYVQFIMLISVEKNNPKAFQFWYYMSDIIRNKKTVAALLRADNFEDFIHSLKESLSSIDYSI